MRVIVLPPGPEPKRLSAKSNLKTLSEHKKAFMNLHNRNGFIEDDFKDYVANYEKVVENNEKVSLNQLLNIRGMKTTQHNAPTRLGTLKYEFKGK